MKGLNTRVFFKTLLVLSALAGTAWALHRIQYGRITGALKREATEKLEAKDFLSAISLLDRLVALEPKRTDEVVELADAYFQGYKDQPTANLPQIIDRQIALDTAALDDIGLGGDALARHMAVMSDEVLDAPLHPYTRGLLDSVPANNPPGIALRQIPGMTPALAQLPPGCAFAPRCSRAGPDCGSEPAVQTLGERQVRCIRPLRDAGQAGGART